MEAVLKPSLKRVEIPFDGPGRRYPEPAVELFFEDLRAHLFQVTERFFLAVPGGKQINRRLASQVFER